MGRPEFPYTAEIAEEFLERMETGEPILSICDSEGMPSWATICKWKRLRPDFATMYARARESSAESCEHRAVAAAEKANDRDSAAAATVQANTLKWAAAKRNPRTHGDRIDGTFTGLLAAVAIPYNPALLPEEQREALRDALLTIPTTIESEPE